jgi:hypothetical protein
LREVVALEMVVDGSVRKGQADWSHLQVVGD